MKLFDLLPFAALVAVGLAAAASSQGAAHSPAADALAESSFHETEADPHVSTSGSALLDAFPDSIEMAGKKPNNCPGYCLRNFNICKKRKSEEHCKQWNCKGPCKEPCAWCKGG